MHFIYWHVVGGGLGLTEHVTTYHTKEAQVWGSDLMQVLPGLFEKQLQCTQSAVGKLPSVGFP